MPKNKRPVPRQSHVPAGEEDEVLAQALADLALELAEREGDDDDDGASARATETETDTATGDGGAAFAVKDSELTRLIRNALRKKNDEVLYGAIERARYADVGAYQLLRARIEEAAGTVLLRREGAAPMEINAFALPLFVHSTGGLQQAADFADPEAFELLVDSLKQAGLESPDAKVVMISHAYDLEEIDRITYSHLQDMVRDAAGSMTEKKLVARPALERSLSGWAPGSFGAGDKAVELRFLLGFALKAETDPFYQAPPDEAGADAFFEARMARYRAWTVQADALVRRCLALEPAAIGVHFLYQDLFFGAKEQGLAELAMLQMMSDINAALLRANAAPGAVHAIAGPADVDDEMVLRVNLYAGTAPGGALLASSDKPLDLAADLQTEVDDICDALSTIGIEQVSVCLKFDRDGQAVQAQPYAPGD